MNEDSIAHMHDILNITPPSWEDASPTNVADFDVFFGGELDDSPAPKQIKQRLHTGMEHQKMGSRQHLAISETNQNANGAFRVQTNARKGGSIHGSITRLKALRNLSIRVKNKHKQIAISSKTCGEGKENINPNPSKRLIPRGMVPAGSIGKRPILSTKASNLQPSSLIIKPSKSSTKSPLVSKPKEKTTKSPPNARSIANIVKRSKNKFQLQSIAKLSKSAVLIQTVARGYLAKLLVNRQKKVMQAYDGIVLFQKMARRWIVRKGALKHGASIKIQKSYRGYISRTLQERNAAATTLQSIYRSHAACKMYTSFRHDVIVCQSAARRMIEAKKVHKLRLAVLFAALQVRNAAAKTIQFVYRGFFARVSYLSFLSNLIVCQSMTRKMISVRRVHRLRLEKFYDKASELHTIYSSAATTIQTAFRACSTRMSYRAAMKNLVICQGAARRMIAMKVANKLKLILQIKAASELQTVIRVAASKIQTVYRGYMARTDFVLLIEDVIMCQSFARMRIAMKNVDSVRREIRVADAKAATTIQCFLRRRAAVKFVVKMIAERKQKALDDSAAIIQTAFRASIVRKHMHKVVICQSVARRMLVLREMDMHQRMSQAATMIQSTCRGFLARAEYVLIKEDVHRLFLQTGAAIKIQTCFRNSVQRIREVRMIQNNAAIRIQSLARYVIAVKVVLYMIETSTLRRQHEAATKLQARVRGIKVRSFVHSLQHGIEVQPNDFYSTVARIESENNECFERAIVKLQACFRGSIARTILGYEHYFATVIQSEFRRIQAVAKIEIDLQNRWDGAIVRLQSRLRGQLIREDMEYLHYCAVQIQSLFRRWKEPHPKKLHLVVQLQAIWRGKMARRRNEKRQVAATAIQTHWRSHLCQSDFAITLLDIITVQSLIRRWLVMKSLRALNFTNMSNDILYSSLELSSQGDISFDTARMDALEAVQVQLFESSFDVEVNQLKREIAEAERVTHELW
jgi:hypothetical protein